MRNILQNMESARAVGEHEKRRFRRFNSSNYGLAWNFLQIFIFVICISLQFQGTDTTKFISWHLMKSCYDNNPRIEKNIRNDRSLRQLKTKTQKTKYVKYKKCMKQKIARYIQISRSVYFFTSNVLLIQVYLRSGNSQRLVAVVLPVYKLGKRPSIGRSRPKTREISIN